MPRRPTSPTPARTAGAASTASGQRLNDLRKAGDLKWFQVWDTAGEMPTAVGEGTRATGGRAECRADILEVVRATGRALTHKQLVRALRGAGKPHGPGTVMKALAELTRAGELVNPKDKRGYRLATWPTTGTPPLF